MSIDTIYFQNLLINRKNEILKILENLKNELKINSCDVKEESDFAACNTNTENNYIISQKLLNELKEIEEALLNIEKGRYGVCQMCEEEINPERLKIKPFAKYCIDCREMIEQKGIK